MTNSYSYDFLKNTFTFTPLGTTGFAAISFDNLFEGTGVEVEFDSDAWMETNNVGGGGTRSLSHNKSASIKVTLPKEDVRNDLLLEILNADTAGDLSGTVTGSFMIRSLANNEQVIFADVCWIKRQPNEVYNAEATGIEWEFRTKNCVRY